MEKYGIYEVHYDEDHSKIEEVKVYEIVNNNVFMYIHYEKSVNDVILEIENGYEYFTLVADSNDNFKICSEVIVYEVDDKKFIKTEGNSDENDNLSELPEY